MRFDWDWAFAAAILPQLVAAMQVTIAATLLGFSVALVGGLLLAVLRRSRRRPLSWTSTAIVEFVRSTPLLIQIYFLFYVMPELGVKLTPFVTGVVALGIHYSSYLSEVYRAGIDAVPRGQWEAAAALDLDRRRTFIRIILPQAIPPVVPALGNYLVAMFKDTPMLSTITVLELLYTARDIGAETFRYLEPLTLVGALFLVVSLVAASGIRLVERRLGT
ncbi:MAG: ectoine/hydroxyectoine ABC transporter permease subunit EhuD [Luteitalea sp.]|nr:ectoine/hydroxyectoine ABC transporter permease subunit EhuD [Luteitalea sp.]